MANSCYSTEELKGMDGTLTFNLTVTLHVFGVPTYVSNLSAHELCIVLRQNSHYFWLLFDNNSNVYPFPFTRRGTLVVCALRALLFNIAKISLICALYAVILERGVLFFVCALHAVLLERGIHLFFVHFARSKKNTFTDRQHSLVMNIHGRRIVRLVRIDAPPSGLSGVRWKTVSLSGDGHGSYDLWIQ